ncbi:MULTISPECIES: LacI family DNA-binding transcriptional regulator [Oscillospiraceae]|uniref:LacI family DNA-binding transcriptional regulator n=1 Tax=Oscillospiraceae TaxID=216572 RepID=UPI00135642D4|nr:MULTISPECIES: LacI family DNA-binding transcriptional regulator [Oscillospiraceae]
MNMNGKQRVTMKDIAQHTGYSINTVSQVLRGIYPSGPTCDKVLAAAKELGYIGNSIASSMRLGSTKTIAIIQSDISNPYFGRLIRNFVNILSERGYTATIYNTDNVLSHERAAVISAIRQNVDGILFGPDDIHSGESVEFLYNSRIPFVVFANDVSNPNISSVRIDEVKGGFLATRHLISQGCRNIVMATAPKGILSAQLRLEGYRQALEKSSLPYRNANILSVPSVFASQGGHRRAWKEVCAQLAQLPFDGIVAFSDQVALKLLQGLREQGFERIAIDQIPIVGFDNILEAFPLPLPLSSIGCAGEDIAHASPRLLLEMIEKGEDFVPQKLVLDVKVYKRQ